jgi:hypothetical protein
MSDEIAKRLRNMVPPKALGQGPDPQVQQLQQMLAQQHEQLMDKTQKMQELQNKAASEALEKDINWYRAETDRIKAVATVDPAALLPIIRQMVSDVLGTPVNQIIARHAAENEMMPGSATQVANQQHAQAMQQQALQHAHDQQMQTSQQQAAAQGQASDQAHQQNMAENAQQQSEQNSQ